MLPFPPFTHFRICAGPGRNVRAIQGTQREQEHIQGREDARGFLRVGRDLLHDVGRVWTLRCVHRCKLLQHRDGHFSTHADALGVH